eukprot:512378_1
MTATQAHSNTLELIPCDICKDYIAFNQYSNHIANHKQNNRKLFDTNDNQTAEIGVLAELQQKHDQKEVKINEQVSVKNQQINNVIIESEDETEDAVIRSNEFRNGQIKHEKTKVVYEELIQQLDEEIVKRGYLYKKSKYMKEWRKRYVVMTNTLLLTYSPYRETSRTVFDDEKSNSSKYILKRLNDIEFMIYINNYKQLLYHFKAQTIKQRITWCNLLLSGYCVCEQAEIDTFDRFMCKVTFAVGNTIKAKDRWNKWYNASIVQYKAKNKEIPTNTNLPPGLRIQDIVGLQGIYVCFSGWSSKYNEWFFYRHIADLTCDCVDICCISTHKIKAICYDDEFENMLTVLPQPQKVTKWFSKLRPAKQFTYLKKLCENLINNKYIESTEMRICYAMLGDLESSTSQQMKYYKKAIDSDNSHAEYSFWKVCCILAKQHEWEKELVCINEYISAFHKNQNNNWCNKHEFDNIKSLIQKHQYEQALTKCNVLLMGSIFYPINYLILVAIVVWCVNHVNHTYHCLKAHEQIMKISCKYSKVSDIDNTHFSEVVKQYHLKQTNKLMKIKYYENILASKLDCSIVLKYYKMTLESIRKLSANNLKTSTTRIEMILLHWCKQLNFDGFDNYKFNPYDYVETINSFWFQFLDEYNGDKIQLQSRLLKISSATNINLHIYAVFTSNNTLLIFDNDSLENKLYEINFDPQKRSVNVVRKLNATEFKLQMNDEFHFKQTQNNAFNVTAKDRGGKWYSANIKYYKTKDEPIQINTNLHPKQREQVDLLHNGFIGVQGIYVHF